MSAPLRIRRSTQVLLAANLVLALVVTMQLAHTSQPPGAAAGSAQASATAVLPDFGSARLAPPPLAQLVDMVERPLFYVERRMPEPPAEAAAAPQTPLRLKLEGIAIAGGSRVAVLRNLIGNVLIQLAEGDTHDGWTLDALSSTGATFSRNGEQRTELLLDPVGNGNRR
jgi:hypothetical protein